MDAWAYSGPGYGRHSAREHAQNARSAPPPKTKKKVLPQKRDVQEVEYSNVAANPETLRNILNEDGVVLVNGVLSESDIKKGVDLFWEAMGTLSPNIDRERVSTWRNQNWPRNYTRGIVQEGGLSGSEFMWFARTRPNVVNLFQIIHETNDLVVSLDTARAIRGQNSGTEIPMHLDVHSQGRLADIPGFQGGINFTDAGPYQSGFAGVVGSHKYYKSFFTRAEVHTQQTNHVTLPKNHNMKERAARPNVKAGSVMIWNMRLIHGLFPSPEKSVTPRCDCLTLTAFASYFPKSKRARGERAVRIQAARCGAPGTHWAIVGTGGTVPTWPRAQGSKQIFHIPSFFAAHEQELSKWI